MEDSDRSDSNYPRMSDHGSKVRGKAMDMEERENIEGSKKRIRRKSYQDKK